MNDRIRELRKYLGLTQKQFAAKIGITNSSISRIEKGITTITESNILSILRTFNVNDKWLRYGEGPMLIEKEFIQEEQSAYYMLGKLAADKDENKIRFVKAMLSLEDQNDWNLIINLIERLANKKNTA